VVDREAIAGRIAVREDAEAVVLDLMKPARVRGGEAVILLYRAIEARAQVVALAQREALDALART
jgi:hypothetical protein